MEKKNAKNSKDTHWRIETNHQTWQQFLQSQGQERHTAVASVNKYSKLAIKTIITITFTISTLSRTSINNRNIKSHMTTFFTAEKNTDSGEAGRRSVVKRIVQVSNSEVRDTGVIKHT